MRMSRAFVTRYVAMILTIGHCARKKWEIQVSVLKACFEKLLKKFKFPFKYSGHEKSPRLLKNVVKSGIY